MGTKKTGNDKDLLYVKNWWRFQHYSKRNPPWIKLHRDLLSDYGFSFLNRGQKGVLIQLWLVASKDDGVINNNLEEIRWQLHDDTMEQSDIDLLIDLGFLTRDDTREDRNASDASNARDAIQRREEKRKEEKNHSSFSSFSLKKNEHVSRGFVEYE